MTKQDLRVECAAPGCPYYCSVLSWDNRFEEVRNTGWSVVCRTDGPADAFCRECTKRRKTPEGGPVVGNEPLAAVYANGHLLAHHLLRREDYGAEGTDTYVEKMRVDMVFHVAVPISEELRKARAGHEYACRTILDLEERLKKATEYARCGWQTAINLARTVEHGGGIIKEAEASLRDLGLEPDE